MAVGLEEMPNYLMRRQAPAMRWKMVLSVLWFWSVAPSDTGIRATGFRIDRMAYHRCTELVPLHI